MLIILAGITLNAVIGEGGIIFQARDTRNKISNETTYDNAQLAQLQNELKDNGLYSGIGIIPGTDNGGGSEGGENGTSGGNQGEQTNSGGNNPGHLVNSGNNQQTGPIIGGDAQDPIIRVIEGEMVAASFYRSDVTIQIYTEDRTQKIKYILSTTVTDITNQLYPSGLVKELDIENGGTLTFTRDGEYTITVYAYDTQGKKSNPVVMWFRRAMDTTTERGITLTASGNEGDNGWYTSNVTIRILGKDAGSTRVTYRVQGTVYEKGTIGNYSETYEYEVGAIAPREIDIANGTTIKVATDGDFTFTAYTYDEIGNRISTSDPLEIKRDATRPVISSFTGEQVINSSDVGQGFQVSIDAIDRASGLTSTPYTYQYKLAPSTAYDTPTAVSDKSKLYSNLDATKTYDMYVIVKDEAGNRVSSDVISKPAFWISSNPNQNEGEQVNGGKEGSLQYTRSPEIEFSFKGQDSNNVDISKIEYEVNGYIADQGSITGKETKTYTAINEKIAHKEEYTCNNGEDKTIQKFKIAIDGDWTVHVHTYNKEGIKVTTNTIRLCRDTVAPTITAFEMETTSSTTASAVVKNDSFGVSGERTGGGYTYYFNNTSQGTKEQPIHNYIGLNKTYVPETAIKVQTKDKAGNTDTQTITDKILHLVHRASVGDYVDINPGTWAESKTSSQYSAGDIVANHLLSEGNNKTGIVVISDNGNSLTVAPIDTTLKTIGTPSRNQIPLPDLPKINSPYNWTLSLNSSYWEGGSLLIGIYEKKNSYYVQGGSCPACRDSGVGCQYGLYFHDHTAAPQYGYKTTGTFTTSALVGSGRYSVEQTNISASTQVYCAYYRIQDSCGDGKLWKIRFHRNHRWNAEKDGTFRQDSDRTHQYIDHEWEKNK